MASICFDSLHDIPGYRMEAGGYSAFICAESGANCIQLQTRKASYLRTPESYQMIKSNPYLYGMPLLFPPNRIKGGTYQFNGITYTFPINEEQRGHHIHGVLSSTPFTPLDPRITHQEASLTFCFEATKEKPYLTFPHTFRMTLTYLLNQDGLHQTLKVQNTDTLPMPIGLGFHTTLCERFLPNTKAEEYFLQIDAKKEILIDRKTIIPTGEFIEENQLLKALREGNLSPKGKALSNHLVAQEGDIKEAIYTHKGSNLSLHYTTSSPFDYWMVFNGGGDKEFVCIEPQTWIIDAPNSPLPPSLTGFRSLAGGACLTVHTTLQEKEN
ncbi:MAG: aldose 1-epimerase [Sphaerochaeta sp.]